MLRSLIGVCPCGRVARHEDELGTGTCRECGQRCQSCGRAGVAVSCPACDRWQIAIQGIAARLSWQAQALYTARSKDQRRLAQGEAVLGSSKRIDELVRWAAGLDAWVDGMLALQHAPLRAIR